MLNRRTAVFETNSSSSHSLTVSSDELACLPALPDELMRGEIVIKLRSFGWEWQRLYRPANKAAYLLVGELQHMSRYGGDNPLADNDEDLRNYVSAQSEKVATIINIMEEQTGCKVLIRGGSCSIDHDSSSVPREIGDSADEIKQFLFSGSYVTLGNDNEHPPLVETDLGTIERVDLESKQGYRV